MAVPERVFKPFKVMLLLLVEVPVAGWLCKAEAVGVCEAEADPESVPVAEALLEALLEAVVASDVTTTPRIRRKKSLAIINGVRDGSRGLQQTQSGDGYIAGERGPPARPVLKQRPADSRRPCL